VFPLSPGQVGFFIFKSLTLVKCAARRLARQSATVTLQSACSRTTCAAESGMQERHLPQSLILNLLSCVFNFIELLLLGEAIVIQMTLPVANGDFRCILATAIQVTLLADTTAVLPQELLRICSQRTNFLLESVLEWGRERRPPQRQRRFNSWFTRTLAPYAHFMCALFFTVSLDRYREPRLFKLALRPIEQLVDGLAR